MTRKILLLTLLNAHLTLMACDCVQLKSLVEARSVFFQESDMVFIGKVISIEQNKQFESDGWFDDGVFEIEVQESFKGRSVGNILKGRLTTSCSEMPKIGLWLIYAKIHEDGYISFSKCGLSRAFNEPERIYFDEYIIRPPTIEELNNPKPNDDLYWAIELGKIKLKAAKDLKKEVSWLRKQKAKIED